MTDTIDRQHTGAESAHLDRVLFNLRHVARIEDLLSADEATMDDVQTILSEAARFSREQLAPLNRDGDVSGATIIDGQVTMPGRWGDAYRAWVDAGWNTITFPREVGGGGLPFSVGYAVGELFGADNISFQISPMLTQGAVDLLLEWARHDTPVPEWIPKLVTGEWAATMNLTEPDAGSDVGALRATAVEQTDGSYRISGTKIFITYGDHDLTDNIVHLVLARRPGAPEGTSGISCFAVPKFLDVDGARRANDITVVSVEHKLGIRATPTAVISYGEDDGATGWLVGEPERGIRCMFTMMNAMRLATGQQNVALGGRALDLATTYAQARRQGRPIGADPMEEPAVIIEHPDVRRILANGHCTVEAMRALTYEAAGHLDRARQAAKSRSRATALARVALLTPAVKGWCSEVGVELCSDAIQVFGGIGYIEETGIAQFWRDARIAPIYEGTTAIHAQDLVFRKLSDAAYGDYLDDARQVVRRLRSLDPDSAARLGGLLESLDRATTSIRKRSTSDPGRAAAAATPYLFVFGPVAAAVSLAGGVVHASDAVDTVDRQRAMLSAFTTVAAAAIAGPSLTVDCPPDPFTVPL